MSGAAFARRIWVLMATVFVDMMGFLIVLPLLPFYAENLGASESMVGALIAIFAFAQLATAPMWGKLSDRYGRRPMILLGLAASAVAFVLFGLAESVAMLFFSRLVQGAGGGTTGVLQAYVSDSVPPEERTQAIGWLTVATSAGVMIGPAIGSLASTLGQEAPGFIAAGLCGLNLVFAWRYLPESFAEAGMEEESDEEPEEIAPPHTLRRSLFQVLRHPGSPVARLIWIYAFGMMAFMAMNGVLALYLERAFGVTAATIGYFYVYVGAVAMLMRGLVLGPVVRRFGEVRTLRLGVLTMLLGLAAFPLPETIWGLAVVGLAMPVGTAFLFPATTSLVSQLAPRRQTGQSLGVQQAFGGVSRMVGPLWSTLAFQHLSIASPFWLASALMGFVSLLTFRIPSDRKHRAPEPAAAEEPVL